MQIVILILKIIGILLAVCLFLLGAVIVVPVRYRISAEVQQKKAEGSAVFYWLFHILDFRLHYSEDGLNYKLRLFGITIVPRKEKEPPAKKHKERRQKKRRKETVNKAKATESFTEIPEKTEEMPFLSNSEEADRPSLDVAIAEPEKVSLEAETLAKSSSQEWEEGQKGNNRSQNGKNKKKRSRRKRTKKEPFFQRIRRFWDNVKQRISNLMAEGETIKEKVLNAKKMITDEANKIVFVKIWRELKFLLRHFSPRKARGELAFGMADPAQTGQVLGALSVLPFWERYRINICPDFEAEALFVEGKLWMKGHIRLWHLFVSVIRLLKDKNVRRLLRKIRT